MARSGFRLPQQQEISEAIKFLTWEQFPKILEKSIEYFSVLPQIGIYKHVNSDVKNFKEALLETTSRQFTISGVGSLFDFERFGNQIKQPTPQLAGTSCGGNSLCLEPTCFGFTEGVIESNNTIQNMCWSLSMPCLKDMLYSDMQFDRKMRRYFEMFFKQAPAVLQAYQRTRLIQESIKVVATDKNFRYSGAVIGGADGQSLPFYINPVDPTVMPNISGIGANIGGLNLAAFMNYVAPRLFAGGGFAGGMEEVTVYGLKQDYMMAKEQTASVMDHYLELETLRALQSRGLNSVDKLDDMIGEFIHDGMFPTFKNVGGQIIPITQEILEASTIAGYVQTNNPEHSMARIRGLLFVPDNWMFNLVEPPKDDFSYLGLGEGLNFRTNTPGVTPLLSSSLFTSNSIGGDGTVILGQTVGKGGMLIESAKGLRRRDKEIKEAVRSEVMMTYSALECNAATAGQLPNVGTGFVPQGRADGFRLKSTMYVGTDVRGTAKPVLLLFQTDTPRSAKPIEVCNIVEVNLNPTAGLGIVNCCPGNQIYAILTFAGDVSASYTVGNSVTYRTGNKAETYVATVTAVSGSVVSIQATNGTSILPCCSGGSDQYGVRAELLNNTTTSLTSSEILKAKWDTGTSSLFISTLKPLVANLINTTGTITLADGTVILVKLSAAANAGVFMQVVARVGETFNLATLDCACLVGAVFSY